MVEHIIMGAQNTFKSISDEELIQKITLTNDTHLFGILYDRYAAIVYNKCYSFINSKEEAQDLTHDIFVKLFVKLKTFNNNSKFSTWLYSFTYNHCVNYLDRQVKSKKNTYSIKDEFSDGENIEDNVNDSQIFEMKADKLNQALQLISPNERALLLMKYQDDLSIKEIAALNEIGESAVKMRLSRAKLNLVNIYNSIIHAESI